MAEYPQDKVRVAQEIADRNLADQLNPEQRQRFDAMVAAGVVKFGEGKGPQPPPREGVMPYLEVVPQAIKNAPKSALNYANTLGQAFLSPIDTANSVGNVALGAMEKVIPGEQDAEKYADAVGAAFKHRFLTEKGFRETLANDPVSLLGDAASIFVAGGGLVKGVGAATKSAPIAKAGETAMSIGAAADPVNLAKGTASLANKAVLGTAEKMGQNIPQKLYLSAIKPSITKLSPTDRAKLAKTALDEQVMPSYKGLDKVDSIVDDLNAMIDDSIAAGSANGKTVDLSKANSYLKEVRAKALDSGAPESYLKIINRTEDMFNGNIRLRGDNPIVPASVAQQIKKSMYKESSQHYKKDPNSPTTRTMADTKKAIARKLKDDLADMFPEISALNAREGALIELRGVLEDAVNRIENRDVVGIGAPIKIATGAAVGGGAGAGLAGVLAAFDNFPKVKARVALAIEKARKEGAKKSAAMTRTRAGLNLAGRANEDTEAVRQLLPQE